MPGFWRLPGAERLIRQLAGELRDGSNLVLCQPVTTPGGLEAAVRSTLAFGSAWQSLAVSDRPSQLSPAAWLLRHVGGELPAGPLTAATLHRSEPFRGQAFWLTGCTAADWPAWREFVRDYAAACRSGGDPYQSQLVLVLEGELAAQAPASELMLAVHQVAGIQDEFDALLWAGWLLAELELAPLERRLVAACVASLCQGDGTAALHLCREPGRVLSEPGALLKELAGERGWQAGDPASIANGRLVWFAGREQPAAAALALSDPDEELPRRLWAAQVGVLLPVIEERRRAIIECYGPLLRVPFTSKYGVIDDKRDLEIGHLELQLFQRQRADLEELLTLLHRLKTVRNALAHLEPAPPQLVVKPDEQYALPAAAGRTCR